MRVLRALIEITSLVLILLMGGHAFALIQIQSSAIRPTMEKRTGNCGLSYVNVIYLNPMDLTIACEGIKRAQSFFDQFGFDSNGQKIEVEFKEEVLNPIKNDKGEIVEWQRVYGLYNRENEKIEMSSWGTDYLMSRKVFDSLPINYEYHTSVVTHEVSHRYHHIMSVQRGFHMAHATSEFIAYNVQIETMADKERAEVLALWPGKKLDYETHINSMIWASDPHAFGVLGYRFWKQDSPDILSRMLKGEFEDPDIMLEVMGAMSYNHQHQ
ncbi:MAG: hypothetical protein H6624_09820 [Bdellovibrionaceae bacterium]|nr:hypothetical protein [Bdellovibrionales bacterium]MCB9084634.1 hypothetical protein [Pseudobdellovibrionaceae bacterium]